MSPVSLRPGLSHPRSVTFRFLVLFDACAQLYVDLLNVKYCFEFLIISFFFIKQMFSFCLTLYFSGYKCVGSHDIDTMRLIEQLAYY